MINMNRIKHLTLYVALILLGMLISTSLISSRATADPAPIAEAPASRPASASAVEAASPASPTAEWTLCTPVNVAAFSSRVHVKCSESVGGIQYFAVPTANAAHAARVLSLLSTAHAAGRTLDILYEPSDTSGSTIGCQASDCRLIVGAAFLQ
jgi:hypothetical protein